MPIVYLGIGSNVGRRHLHIQKALRQLKAVPKTKVLKTSPLYETSPWGGITRQRPFVNGVVKLETELPMSALWARLQTIEKNEGRLRTKRWGPRTLDLDILFYGQSVCRKKSLRVPHPSLAERKFVLAPLSDVAPGFRHPVLGKTVQRLLRELQAPDQKVRLLS